MKTENQTNVPKSKPPIVVVLGHVDHGKTTLLDRIRKTSVAKKEAGGITQGIGFSTILTKDKREITFIDTPGHSAFSSMRDRGVRSADIAILVVAVDDGVKPQTKEAIEYITSSKIPFIVAITKVDLGESNIESVKGQLEKEGACFEGRGGDTPVVALSASTGQGVEELLEMISLVSDIHGFDKVIEGPLEAVVIESRKGKSGAVVSLVVRKGKISVGDEIVASGRKARVKGIFTEKQKAIKEILPGRGGLILGFKDLPESGSVVKLATDVSEGPYLNKRRNLKVEEGSLPIVIKADSLGSLEAVIQNLPEKVSIVSSGVGDINESDIFVAKSDQKSFILGFKVGVSKGVNKLAETEGISVDTFEIIYKLFERIEELQEEGRVKILGKAKVLAEFPFDKKRIAGCKVLQGEIKVGDRLFIEGGEEKEGGKVVSMGREKNKIELARSGEECGILISPQLDFKIGDVLVSIAKRKKRN